MKETRFIAQNKEKWLDSENLLKQEFKDPEKLSTLFTHVVDDLSYSRTYYPNRSVRVYLNRLAREFFSIIYSRQRHRKNLFRLFWTDELPQIIIHCRRELIISFLFFSLAMAIGVFSAMNDPSFVSSILGESYVAMTKENISKGDPMAVYKASNELDMFLSITVNNLMVAFRTYVFGIFLSIGSLAILMYNGLMVGCFQYFFVEQGLFRESALTIWLHGTLEISSVVIAGGAGLTLGSGLVFPGTYSRLQAFQISGMRSLKLMLGISPIFVVAGIIESFLTRYTDAPDAIRLLLIIVSAGLIIGYFVVYPWYKSRRGFEVPLEEVRLAPQKSEPPNFKVIKNIGEILHDSFIFYKSNFGKLFPWILVASAISAAARWSVDHELATFRLVGDWYEQLFGELLSALSTSTAGLAIVNAVGVSIALFATYRIIAKSALGGHAVSQPLAAAFTLALCGLVFLCLEALTVFGSVIVFIGYLVVLLAIYQTFFSGRIRVSGRLFKLLGANFPQVLALHLVLLLVLFAFLILLSSPALYLYIQVAQWNLSTTDTWVQDAVLFLQIFVRVLSFYITLPILAAASAFLYHSLAEIADASFLKQAIQGMTLERQKSGKR